MLKSYHLTSWISIINWITTFSLTRTKRKIQKFSHWLILFFILTLQLFSLFTISGTLDFCDSIIFLAKSCIRTLVSTISIACKAFPLDSCMPFSLTLLKSLSKVCLLRGLPWSPHRKGCPLSFLKNTLNLLYFSPLCIFYYLTILYRSILYTYILSIYLSIYIYFLYCLCIFYYLFSLIRI